MTRDSGDGGSAPAAAPGAAGSILDAYEAWRAWPLRLHATAALILAAVAGFRWWQAVAAPRPLYDEAIYLGAAALVVAGESPYGHDLYFYPAFLAWVVGSLVEATGTTGALGALRALNVLGLAATAWLAVAWAPLAMGWRLALSAGVVALAPGAWLGLQMGNVSFAVAAATLLGLMLWKRLPVASGVLLGAGVAVKPVAAITVLLLGAHRPAVRTGAHLLAAGVGAATVAVILLSGGFLGEFLQMGIGEVRSPDEPPLDRSVSLRRWLHTLGLEIPPIFLVAGIAALGLVAARARRWTPLELLCLCLAGLSLSSPVLWSHSLIVILPVQVAAISLAVGPALRAPSSAPRSRSDSTHGGALRRVSPLIGVLLGVAALHLGDRVEAVPGLPGWTETLFLTPPTFATALLAGYVVWQVGGGSVSRGGTA